VSWGTNPGLWQGWLTEAAVKGDAEEVKRRLSQVPESIRGQVRIHAKMVWKIKWWQNERR